VECAIDKSAGQGAEKMPTSATDLKGLDTFLDDVRNSSDPDEFLRKANMAPEDYGMDNAKDLVDYWHRIIQGLKH
jgi:hypothetical protein